VDGFATGEKMTVEFVRPTLPHPIEQAQRGPRSQEREGWGTRTFILFDAKLYRVTLGGVAGIFLFVTI
jgi:hypothetical protein